MKGINKARISFISSIDVSSNNYKKVQITNLLVDKTDVFDNSIVNVKNHLIKRIMRFTEQKDVLESRLSFVDRTKKLETINFDIPLKILKIKNKIYYLTEQNKSISEMRIIYMYKCYEIKIMQLIGVAYPGEYRWNFDIKKIDDFLAKHGIYLYSIKGSAEFEELRLVNNHIKHNSNLAKLNEINEFKSNKVIEPHSLDIFLERVKTKVNNFFIDLANNAIEKL